MSQHTPGPWRRYKARLRPGHIGGNLFPVVREVHDRHGNIIVSWGGFDGLKLSKAETDANLRLMAAAPELLEALKAVVSVADRRTVEFDAARAAIAKAEGRRRG